MIYRYYRFTLTFAYLEALRKDCSPVIAELGDNTNSIESIEVLKVLEQIRHQEGRLVNTVNNGNPVPARFANDVR